MASPVDAAQPGLGHGSGDPGRSRSRHKRGASRYEKIFLILFVFTLPLINPWVRGDGIGYYAYARALLIDHNLRFEKDWQAGNPGFVMSRVDEGGKVKAGQYTSTGYLNNHFAVGPAMLWAPFLAAVHVTVLGLDAVGAHIPADGFSRPYRVAMALATAFYGFLGLCLAFRLAREYFDQRWAFLGTVGIWFGSSLPVYMYFNPSWSHAHSAFAVALFLWCWHRTRERRTLGQWALLGALAGLMVDVYYPNGVFILVPLLESLRGCGRAWRAPDPSGGTLRGWLVGDAVFTAAFLAALVPTFTTRWIIFGSPFRFGAYTEMQWNWKHPMLWNVLFSSNHGLLTWTPILIPAVLGLLLLRHRDRAFFGYLLACFLAFTYVIASYSLWHGISSYGNRFFVSLTPVFILGLTACWAGLAQVFRGAGRAFAVGSLATGCFILWNMGLMFQWGTHMIPVRGAIDCRQMVYNQVAVVPGRVLRTAKTYLVARGALMGDIEREDIKQQQQAPEGR